MCPKHSLVDSSTAYDQANEEFRDSVLGSGLLPLDDELEKGFRLAVSDFEVDSNGESTIQGTNQERGDSGPIRSAYKVIPLSLQSVFVSQSRGDPLYNGSPLWGYNPGFYTGASGIGYQFIRLAYPESLPSILLWDV